MATKKKIEFLTELFERGHQHNFRVKYSRLEGGKVVGSRWRHINDCWGDEKFLETVNQVEQLPNLIILDFDEGTLDDYNALITRIRDDGLKFSACATKNGRARHIWLWFTSALARLQPEERKKVRSYIIGKYGCDHGFNTDAHLVPLPGFPHWKTGDKIELIDEELGMNGLTPILDEFRSHLQLEKADSQLNSFVLDESELPQRIDHSVGLLHIQDDSYRYYGVFLYEKVIGDMKGVQIVTTKRNPCLILEDGRIISKSNCPRGFNFEFQSVMTSKDNRWSQDSINEFVRGQSEDISFTRVYAAFKASYDKYMVFEHPTWYKLNALWDMQTYYWDLIDKSLILKREGVSDAGKSKAMRISANQTFNGKKFLCPTPANFFRYRHNNKATLYIEEAERLFDDSKKGQNGDSDLIEYLNGSYERGNTVPRQNDKNIQQTDEFDPFGFTQIGAIKPLKGALNKRSLTQGMITAKQSDVRSQTEVSVSDPEFKNIRNMAYLCGLQHWREYKTALDQLENRWGLVARQWHVSKPLLAMASCISDDLLEEIGLFLSERFEVRDEAPDHQSWEFLMSCVMVESFSTSESEQFISNAQLRERFLTVLDDQYRRVSQHKITALIKSLGFQDCYVRNVERTDRGYSISFWKVCEILLRNRKMTFYDIQKKVSEVSLCPINQEKLSKWYLDTFQGEEGDKTSDTSSDSRTDLPDSRTDGHFIQGGSLQEYIFKELKKVERPTVKVADLFGNISREIDISPSDFDDVLRDLKSRGEVFEPRSGEVGLVR